MLNIQGTLKKQIVKSTPLLIHEFQHETKQPGISINHQGKAQKQYPIKQADSKDQ